MTEWIHLPARAFCDQRVKGSHIRIIAAISVLGAGALSHRQIRTESGVQDRNLRRSLAQLVDYGYLTITEIQGAASVYAIIVLQEGGRVEKTPPGVKKHPGSLVSPPDAPPSSPAPQQPPLYPPTSDISIKPRIKAEFEEFWLATPRKIGKGAAETKYWIARRAVDRDDLLAAIKRYAERRRGEDQQFTVHPATWLHQKRWLDDDGAPVVDTGPKGPPPKPEDIWPDYQPEGAPLH